MPRRFLKRHLPKPHHFREHRHLRHLGARLHDPNLWHLNRRSVAGGVAAGLFSAFLPMPFEMVVAAVLAMLFRVNLPIAVVLVWISNPFTWVPLYGGAYLVGAWLLGQDPVALSEVQLTWLLKQAAPLWLGCVVVGTVTAVTGFGLTRLAWNIRVRQHWARRRQRQRAAGCRSRR